MARGPLTAEGRRDGASAAATCGLAAVSLAVAVPLLGGLARSGYRHAAQYISELGESGAPHGPVVNFLGFLPIGVLTLLFVALAGAQFAPHARARLGLLLFSGVGWAYIGATLFPCDPGCPSAGSASQAVHSSLGLAEYLGGGIGLLLLSGTTARRGAAALVSRRLSLAAAFLVLGAFAGMVIPALQPLRGLVQRVAETALFGWILVASLHLMRRSAIAQTANTGAP